LHYRGAVTEPVHHAPPPQQFIWNEGVGQAWADNADLIDAHLSAFGDRAMAALSLQPGETVFDVGCGGGRTTVRLARQVGPTGQALGIDISRPMLQAARDLAQGQGVINVEFAELDLQKERPSLLADAAFSRFGVMFFDQPQVAFANLALSMRPGGRLVFVCWDVMERNPWMFVSRNAAAEYLPIPPMPVEGPGPLAFANNDYVRSLLEGAGFSDVQFETFETSPPLAGGNDLDQVASIMLSISPMALIFKSVDQSTQLAIKQKIIEAVEPYLTSDGVRMPAVSWVVSARR
jgi:SAM-dependent methyltransferase